MVVDVAKRTEGTAHVAAQGDAGVCPSLQQLLHCLDRGRKQVQDKVRFCAHLLVCVCVCGGAGGVTRSFPLAIARESGECPLQRRSVLALWESRRATTLLAFCTETNKHTSHLNGHQ